VRFLADVGGLVIHTRLNGDRLNLRRQSASIEDVVGISADLQ
jgi:hypothetical protein